MNAVIHVNNSLNSLTKLGVSIVCINLLADSVVFLYKS